MIDKKRLTPPYLSKAVLTMEKLYNPEYGDERVCVCGHPYYRHFDSYEDNKAVGCKYCECTSFIETEDPILSLVSAGGGKEIHNETNGSHFALTRRELENFAWEITRHCVQKLVHEKPENLTPVKALDIMHEHLFNGRGHPPHSEGHK